MNQDMNQSFNIELHDIKPLVEIQEYSFYYLLGISLVVISVVFAIIFFAYKWYQNRSRFNQRANNLKIINALDFKDTKHSAYTITMLGAIFKDDSPRHQEMYDNLTKRLQEYKYKKEVAGFDDEVKGYIELYKSMLDV